MRNISIFIIVFSILLSSCKKDLENRFYNPDQLGANTTDIVPGLFTQIVSNNKILIQDYGEWYYLLNGGTSIPGYAQLANRYISYRYDWFSSFNDLTTGNGFDDYPITGQSYFENSYLRLKPWETIRNEMSKRQGADRANAEMYFRLATIMKDYQSAKLVDFYNSIPYFDAFQGNNQTTGAWYPVYDDPKAIYESIITELGHLVDSLPVFYNNMDATAKTILAKQDIVFGGNINKWVQYTNALRIKYLVRISGVDAAFAQSGLQAALTKPLLDADLEFKMWAPVDVLGGGTWQRGLYENTFASFIPGVIMKRLNYDSLKYQPGIDDPRLPVLAMPTKYHDYRSITFNIDQQTPLYDGGDKYYPYADNIPSSLSTNAKSMYNIVTLSLNSAMPVYVFSRTEQDLLLAEIALKGLANTGKLPGDHISDAVVHSVNYWYRINQLSTASRGVDDAELYPTKPSDAAILAWATVVRGKFDLASGVEDKMEILMQQKYIHLNLLAPYELWAELRRTGHPKLEPFVWHGSIWKPFPERVRYPASEQKNNTTNFAKVASDNNLTSKIFWVPSNRTTDLYWSDNTFK